MRALLTILLLFSTPIFALHFEWNMQQKRGDPSGPFKTPFVPFSVGTVIEVDTHCGRPLTRKWERPEWPVGSVRDHLVYSQSMDAVLVVHRVMLFLSAIQSR